ncbi:MAG: ABC transporter permease [Anaerolineales bacterium]|nr:ABC transporter permease [Anaerolineales bacterium]
MSTLIIARLTFKEAARRKILLAALLLGLVFLAIFGVGFHYVNVDVEKAYGKANLVGLNEIRNFMLLAGMYVVNFLTAIMTVLTSVDTLSGEINSGTIHTLVAKPLRRWEVVLGKWLGFAGMISLYLLLMGGGVMLLVYLRADYIAPHPLSALALIWLNALLLLSVSLLGGTMFSTLANGVLVFGLYGIAFIGGWIEQIGGYLSNQAASQTAVNVGVITSLMMPSEALWRRAAYEMQSPLVSILGATPFSSGTYPSTAMMIYAGLYLLAMLAWAMRQFSRRDL